MEHAGVTLRTPPRTKKVKRNQRQRQGGGRANKSSGVNSKNVSSPMKDDFGGPQEDVAEVMNMNLDYMQREWEEAAAAAVLSELPLSPMVTPVKSKRTPTRKGGQTMFSSPLIPDSPFSAFAGSLSPLMMMNGGSSIPNSLSNTPNWNVDLGSPMMQNDMDQLLLPGGAGMGSPAFYGRIPNRARAPISANDSDSKRQKGTFVQRLDFQKEANGLTLGGSGGRRMRFQIMPGAGMSQGLIPMDTFDEPEPGSFNPMSPSTSPRTWNRLRNTDSTGVMEDFMNSVGRTTPNTPRMQGASVSKQTPVNSSSSAKKGGRGSAKSRAKASNTSSRKISGSKGSASKSKKPSKNNSKSTVKTVKRKRSGGYGGGPDTFRSPAPRSTGSNSTKARFSGNSRQRAADRSADTSLTAGAQEEAREPCNCKKSKCLKLYCVCFAAGIYCSGCNCTICENNKENETARRAAVQATLERNPHAFKPKISNLDQDPKKGSDDVEHSKGCHCKRSFCLKKYCECFQANIFCGANCKCENCQNFHGSPMLTKASATKKSRSAGPRGTSVRIVPLRSVKPGQSLAFITSAMQAVKKNKRANVSLAVGGSGKKTQVRNLSQNTAKKRHESRKTANAARSLPGASSTTSIPSRPTRRFNIGKDSPSETRIFGTRKPKIKKNVVFKIFSFLDNEDLLEASLVSKQFSDRALDEEVWHMKL